MEQIKSVQDGPLSRSCEGAMKRLYLIAAAMCMLAATMSAIAAVPMPNGSTVVWGDGTVPSPNPVFIAMAGGGEETLALTVPTLAGPTVTLSGTAGATTAVVSGSGSTYNVVVTGMTASGTVVASIAAGVAHDAAGNPNMASTSADNTVNYSKVAGSVVAWGCNKSGQCNVPSPNSGFIAVSGGAAHSLQPRPAPVAGLYAGFTAWPGHYRRWFMPLYRGDWR